MDLSRLYREAFEKIKADAMSNHIEITDEEYLGGYFVIDMGDSSVVHFKVDGCKDWLFGCWFDYNEDKKSYPITVDLFCQHERYLDKFKPSRGTYSISTSINIVDDAIESIDAGFIYEFVEICRFIHKHPYLAYDKDVHYTDYNYKKQKPVMCFLKYYRDGARDWFNNAVSNYLDKKLIKFVKKYANDNFGQYDWEILDEDCSPRYTLRVELPDGDEQETGIFGLFNDDDTELAWKRLTMHCNKIANKLKMPWHSSCVIDDCVIFWNKKEWDEYCEKEGIYDCE